MQSTSGIWALLLASLCQPVAACPWCQSDIGTQVQAGIFNADFAHNLVTLVLPFPLLLLVVALIYFWPPAKVPNDAPRD